MTTSTQPTKTKSNEWYTPQKYIDAAREVLGEIDLDPASCALANETVKAKRYFSLQENGLLHPWHGRIWLNPPYGINNAQPSKMQRWIDKANHEYQSGNAQEIIILVNALPDRVWFQPLWSYPLCFVRKRIRFFSESGQSGAPQYGNVFAYLGPYEDKFINVFWQFGVITRRIDPTVKQIGSSRGKS
jgi:hypothetical protein